MDNTDCVAQNLKCDQQFVQENDNPDVRNSQEEKSFWALCKDKRSRGKLFLSFCLGCSLLCVWLVETQLGSTLLDLQIITRTDLEEASGYFTVHTGGYMIGCTFCIILSKKIRPIILISSGLFTSGASAIATPLCSSYSLMMAIRWLSGIFSGITEPVIYAEQMRIWQDEGKSVTQLIMLMATAGLFLAPVVSEPFLAPKSNQTTIESILEQGENSTAGLISRYTNRHLNSSTDKLREEFRIDLERSHQTTNVFYAFLITGGFTIIISVLFFLCYRINSARAGKESKLNIKKKGNYRSIPVTLKVILASSFCLYSLFTNAVGLSFFSFLMAFLVNKYEHITKSQGAYILMLFVCCGTGSRVLLICLSDRVRARYLLGFFVILGFVSFVSFTLAAEFGHTAALIILTGVVNVAIAPAFPLSLSWCQTDYLEVSTSLSSCMTFASALGFMSNPLLLSHLMGTYGDMWFCYLHTIEAFIPMAILFTMFSFNKYYVDRKYGPLLVSLTQKESDDEAMMTDLQANSTNQC